MKTTSPSYFVPDGQFVTTYLDRGQKHKKILPTILFQNSLINNPKYLPPWKFSDKLASFKGDQRLYRGQAASHLGAAVLAQVARSRRSEPLLDERSLKLKLASFKEDQRPNRCNAASHVGAAVLVHVARSGQLDAALR